MTRASPIGRLSLATRRCAIAACSGGGGGTNVAPITATTTPLSGATGTLTLTIPRNVASTNRLPRFVSPNSAFLRTTVKSVNDQAPRSTRVPQDPSTVALSTGANGNC